MTDPTESHGNLFPIFLLSLIQFFLVPITIFRVGGWLLGDGDKAARPAAAAPAVAPADASSEWGKAAAAHAARNKPTTSKRIKALFRGFNLYVSVAWAMSAALAVYIAYSAPPEHKVFDPYEILQLTPGADASAIKKAYRTLSLRYHPDKNPDPEAHEFFTGSITPAYKALTDENSRVNYEKYGHPDGKQPVKLGVALPAWMFGQDGTGPYVLMFLVAFGILLPMFFAVCAIQRMNKYGGDAGKVLRQTFQHFMMELRPNLALTKVPKMLSVAMEFINIPFKRDQEEGFRKLAVSTKSEYDSKDQKFMKRHPAILKAHMLMLAQACRKTNDVDASLQADLKTVMGLFPRLAEEALKITLAPVNQLGYSFMRPGLSILEFTQCVTQAVAPSARKPSDKPGQVADGLASLLTLPHVDERTAVNLTRKKVKSLADLLATPGPDARASALAAAGLSARQAADVEAHLRFVPSVKFLTATVETEGEADVVELDAVTCRVTLKMTRGANARAAEKDEDGKDESAAATASAWGRDEACGLIVRSRDDLPPLPFCTRCEREEGWWLAVTDPAANFILSCRRLTADVVAEAQQSPKGKQLELKFNVPTAGIYSLQVKLLSDYWIGVDASWGAKVKVLKRTNEVMEKRMAAAAAAVDEEKSAKAKARKARLAAAAGEGEGVGESGEIASESANAAGSASDSDDLSDLDSDDDSDDGLGRHGDDDYPSEETGTEESSDEEEDDAFFANGEKKPAAAAAKLPEAKPAAAVAAKSPEAKPAAAAAAPKSAEKPKPAESGGSQAQD